MNLIYIVILAILLKKILINYYLLINKKVSKIVNKKKISKSIKKIKQKISQ